MPIQVDWIDAEDKTIIRLYYESIWTWQDAIDGHIKVNQLMKAVEHPVAIIIDMTESQYVPPGSLSKVRELSQMRGRSPNDTGITVFLNADILTKALVDFVELIDAKDLPELQALFAKSLDNAIKLAHQELAKYNANQEN